MCGDILYAYRWPCGGQIEDLRRSLKQVRQDNEQHVEELDKLRHEKSVLVNTTHAAKRAKTDLEVGQRDCDHAICSCYS